jgi:hypothetical protein
MFGEADIHAYLGRIVHGDIQIAVFQCFIGTVDAKTPGAGAFFVFFLFAIKRLWKGTYPGWSLAEVSELDFLYFTDAVDKLFSVFLYIYAIWCGEPYAGDYYSSV